MSLELSRNQERKQQKNIESTGKHLFLDGFRMPFVVAEVHEKGWTKARSGNP